MNERRQESGIPGDDSHLVETGLRRQDLLRGHFLHVVRDTVRLPGGREASREYVIHPGAVMIIALLDNGQVVLERQYRHPLRQVMIEFPAGKLDPGEGSLDCAQRELREETGYTAREWVLAGQLAPTIAYSDETIDIWFARGVQPGPRRLDDGEFLDVLTATPQELLGWCRNGHVVDAKTLTGMLWLQNQQRGDWVLDWPAAPPPASR